MREAKPLSLSTTIVGVSKQSHAPFCFISVAPRPFYDETTGNSINLALVKPCPGGGSGSDTIYSATHMIE